MRLGPKKKDDSVSLDNLRMVKHSYVSIACEVIYAWYHFYTCLSTKSGLFSTHYAGFCYLMLHICNKRISVPNILNEVSHQHLHVQAHVTTLAFRLLAI